MNIALVLSDDLLFASRITATARALGLTLKTVRTVAQLEVLAQQESPSCVILDLANPTLRVRELLDRLRTTYTQPPRVVAYGSHVDADTLRAARAAGCDFVLPRSKFAEDLAEALPGWMACGKEDQTAS